MIQLTSFPESLVLAGAGKMGGAMLDGWLAAGMSARAITVVDPAPTASLTDAATRHGFRIAAAADAGRPSVLVLGIKPQGLAEAAPALGRLVGPDTLVISILAGKTVANLFAALPGARSIVRAMPNLPASIGRGATGAFANAHTTDGQRGAADALLRAVGIVEWVDTENLIDAVTAVSGSGPAYAFLLAECLADAARSAGLPAPLADRLALHTVAGAGALMATGDLPPARLRENVTSPGGTTAAALDVLMGPGGMRDLMGRAVDAARRRAGELSG